MNGQNDSNGVNGVETQAPALTRSERTLVTFDGDFIIEMLDGMTVRNVSAYFQEFIPKKITGEARRELIALYTADIWMQWAAVCRRAGLYTDGSPKLPELRRKVDTLMVAKRA